MFRTCILSAGARAFLLTIRRTIHGIFPRVAFAIATIGFFFGLAVSGTGLVGFAFVAFAVATDRDDCLAIGGTVFVVFVLFAFAVTAFRFFRFAVFRTALVIFIFIALPVSADSDDRAIVWAIEVVFAHVAFAIAAVARVFHTFRPVIGATVVGLLAQLVTMAFGIVLEIATGADARPAFRIAVFEAAFWGFKRVTAPVSAVVGDATVFRTRILFPFVAFTIAALGAGRTLAGTGVEPIHAFRSDACLALRCFLRAAAVGRAVIFGTS